MACNRIVFVFLVTALACLQAQQLPKHGTEPAVSPDGSTIAFLSDRDGGTDVFIICADGTGERQLTHTGGEKGGLGWAADGKQILFSVFSNDSSHLYSVDLKGRNQRQIASVSGRSPTLSPDGKLVLYMAGTWTSTRLMVSGIDGSNIQQITNGESIAWNSHWSPSGKLIAFTGRKDPKGDLAIFVMNADGTHLRQVGRFAPGAGNAQWPVWSPDGRELAVQANRLQEKDAHIWIVDLQTGDARKLAAHSQPYLDETPYWFPDGKRIAFQSDRTGRMEVWVMNADGSGQSQITR